MSAESHVGFGPIAASPMSEQNAVRSANDYLSMSSFSRQGLIDQLVVGEGYSTEDATLAVNSLTVDWNQQAVKAARDYLSMSPFSRQGLVEQLVVGDGYTQSQAEYGVSVVYQ
ncbi:MAG: Ltp family lipoprotein [Mycobacterium sp.]